MKGEIVKLKSLVARNIKLYFKDKVTFFVSLITPLILVVLFLTFLRNVYVQSLVMSLPEGVTLDSRLINGFTGGWLFSSIMTTSCITVAFCSNMLVGDKLNNVYSGLEVTPVKKTTLLISYVIANFITTVLICSILLVIGFIYLAIVGWYLSFVDILIIIAAMILTCLIGSLLMSTISYFINTQGALSGVCTMVSSMYGFLCGAYMPLSQMGKGMQNFASFIPGTYGTVLFRQGFMNGTLKEMAKAFGPEGSQYVDIIRQSFDGSFRFFGHNVPSWVMFVVLIGTIAALLTLFILITKNKVRRKIKK